MKKKIWAIIAAAAVIIASVVVILLRMTGGSHTAIDNNPEPAVSGESSTLVAYFSWSGNGQQMADWIADETGGDLFRIVPAEPYGEDFDATADRAQQELNDETRPPLSEHIDPAVMTGYDVIYLGFPIWWYDLPTPVWTFLEEYDLSGKTIIPFFSHNGSSNGASSLSRIGQLAKGANVLTDDALSIRGSNVKNSETQVRKWAAETSGKS